MIRQYIRDENRNPVGVIVAISPTKFGWAFCHPKTSKNSGDRWNKIVGVSLAQTRASMGEVGFIPRQHTDAFSYTLACVIRKAIRFFHNEKTKKS
jgi:hypothetical protein